ncbi:MAG TPA: 30S ribosome-binding factor RbfA, partial [Polyangiaceae bacterium]
MPTESRRPRRVAEAIRATLAEALNETLSDPALSGTVITDVSVSDDLLVAHIGVRRLMDDGNEASRQRLVRHLEGAHGRLRRILGPRLELRKVPELRFFFDGGPDKR